MGLIMLNEDRKETLKEKLAKLRVGDIEDAIGTTLDDKTETRVRKMIGNEKANSFSMRHPYLTGIPTLGIAPAMAEARAKDRIVKRLARSSAKQPSSAPAQAMTRAQGNSQVDWLNKPENLETMNNHLETIAKQEYGKPLKDLPDAEWEAAAAKAKLMTLKNYKPMGKTAEIAKELLLMKQKEASFGRGVRAFGKDVGDVLKSLVSKTKKTVKVPTEGGSHTVKEVVESSPLASALGKVLLYGGTGAGAYGAVKGIDSAMDSYSSKRGKEKGWNNMLDENPSLKRMGKADQGYAKKVFRTLHSFNPKMAEDPLVSGSFVRRALQFQDEGIQPMDVKTLTEVSKQISDSKKKDGLLQSAFAGAAALGGI
jgi:hypothetical protein